MNTFHHYSVLGGYEPIKIPDVSAMWAKAAVGLLLLACITLLVVIALYGCGKPCGMDDRALAPAHHNNTTQNQAHDDGFTTGRY